MYAVSLKARKIFPKPWFRPVQRPAWHPKIWISSGKRSNLKSNSRLNGMLAMRNPESGSLFVIVGRTLGKDYELYCQRAKNDYGIRFVHSRPHTVEFHTETDGLSITFITEGNSTTETEIFDMVVLAVGQRPTPETKGLAEQAGIELNTWGFPQTAPFSLTQTSQEGVVIGGSFSGLKDISESVIQASAAAANASRVIHSTGGGLALQPSSPSRNMDILRENPKILVALCTCGESLSPIVENHLISADPAEYPVRCRKYAEQLRGRSMLVKKTKPLPVECIVRGYISGSGWLEYQSKGSICDISLPEGLIESEKLPYPLFTPSTKADKGIHDENISFERVTELLGNEALPRLVSHASSASRAKRQALCANAWCGAQSLARCVTPPPEP